MRWPIGELLETERPFLLTYLRRISEPAEAEDAFQEIALRALRSEANVREPRAWLYGIARHVIRGTSAPDIFPSPAALRDPHSETEQILLSEALARSLAVLPEEIRSLLIEHHAQGTTLAELGRQKGLGEGALAARLARARRRVADDLSPEVARALTGYGIPLGRNVATRIWCPRCADRRLDVTHPADLDWLALTCRGCGISLIDAEGHTTAYFRGSAGVAVGRFLTLTHAVFSRWQDKGPLRCPSCTAVGQAKIRARDGHLESRCRVCGLETVHTPREIALAHPGTRQFWRTQGRIEEDHSPLQWVFVSRKTNERRIHPLCTKSGVPLP